MSKSAETVHKLFGFGKSLLAVWGCFDCFNHIEQCSLILKNPQKVLKHAQNAHKLFRILKGLLHVWGLLITFQPIVIILEQGSLYGYKTSKVVQNHEERLTALENKQRTASFFDAVHNLILDI